MKYLFSVILRVLRDLHHQKCKSKCNTRMRVILRIIQNLIKHFWYFIDFLHLVSAFHVYVSLFPGDHLKSNTNDNGTMYLFVSAMNN